LVTSVAQPFIAFDLRLLASAKVTKYKMTQNDGWYARVSSPACSLLDNCQRMEV
jgi:hypothetical protein